MLKRFFIPALAALAMNASFAQSPAALEGTWLLQSVAGQAAQGAHLSLSQGRATGNDACNNFSGSYSTAGVAQALRFAPQGMASTMMACPPEAEAVAQPFKAALAQTHSYSLSQQTLSLLGAEGQTLATFALQDDNLVGTQWQITGLNNGRNAVVSQASTEALRLKFLPKGKLQAQAACGLSVGTYSLQPQTHSLEVGQVCIRGQGCPRFDPQREELAQLHQALLNSSSYRRTGDKLELRDKDGALQISASLLP